MDGQVTAALITAISGLIVAGLGWQLRNKSKSAKVVRRSLDRQEALENYVFTLRRQIFGSGGKPRSWPAVLRYLNRDDPDEGTTDDE